MRFGFSLGPITNLEAIDVDTDWHVLAERLRHKTGDKDGPYLVRGPCGPKRCDANLTDASLLIIDGDKGFTIGTGELTNAPGAWSAHEAMAGLAHVVTTSHSHRPEAPRWRLWMPTDRPFTREECQPITAALHARLVAAGCPVALSPESYRWSQGWFMPRCPRGTYPERYESDGEPVSIDDLLAEAPKPEVRNVPENVHRSSGPINEFNASHDLEGMLLSAGYRYRGQRRMSDGTPARLFIHPGSESGIPGTVLFRSRRGKEVVMSFSGNDPLCREREGRPVYLDAWDVAKFLGRGILRKT